MAKSNQQAKKSKSRKKGMRPLPVIEPHAAGIDVGATEMYVAVPPDHDQAKEMGYALVPLPA